MFQLDFMAVRGYGEIILKMDTFEKCKRLYGSRMSIQNTSAR